MDAEVVVAEVVDGRTREEDHVGRREQLLVVDAVDERDGPVVVVGGVGGVNPEELAELDRGDAEAELFHPGEAATTLRRRGRLGPRIRVAM